MPNLFRIRRFGRLVARAAVVLSVLVLVCVPAMTRVGQRLETASHAPSFAKNIDCPPKKVMVAPVWGLASPTPLRVFETLEAVRLAPSPDTTHPRAPFRSSPRPLRAPPSLLPA